jgi:tetratricopeptide (TPR) repeat protein
MRRMGWAAGLALCAAGCAPTLMERVHNCNEDGVVLFGRGAYEPARQCFQAALTLQPDNADLMYNLGQCYDRLGNSAQAEQFYHNCLQRSPDHTECRHALALLLLREDRRQEAVQMVEEWLQQAWQEYSRLEHSPQLAAAFTEDGWLYAQSNDTERALKRYQQALFYDQHYARTLAEMGRPVPLPAGPSDQPEPARHRPARHRPAQAGHRAAPSRGLIRPRPKVSFARASGLCASRTPQA